MTTTSHSGKYRTAIWFFICLLTAGAARSDNNFTKRLAVVDGAFSLERESWILIESNQSGPAEIAGNKFILKQGKGFVELPAGKFLLKDVPGTSFQVRQVPALLFYKFVGACDRPDTVPYDLSTKSANGRDAMFLYNWPWLRKHILDNFNMVMTFFETPEIDQWRAEGRKTVCEGALLSGKTSKDYEEDWQGRLQRYPNSGILLDEFIIPVPEGSPNSAEFGYTHPGVGFDPGTLAVVGRLGKELRSRGSRIYPWLGLPWRCHGRDVTPLLNTVKECSGRIVWEAYSFSRNWQDEINNRLARRITEFLQADPDIMHHMLIAPSTMEFSERNAAVDFKAFLDRQFHLMANDPQFNGIAGITFWGSPTTKPENLRWLTELIRHYCLLGEKSLLSDRYGFQIEPDILVNPEWTDGLAAWEINPAQPDSIDIATRTQWPEMGFKPGYFPKAPEALLLMKRNPDKPNRIWQTLENLQPGKRYALTVQVTAIRKESRLERYAVDFTLENCRIDDVLLRPMFDYTSSEKTNTLCWNNYEILFQYLGPEPAALSIADQTGSGCGPGTNAIQAESLLIDGIRIAPYFE